MSRQCVTSLALVLACVAATAKSDDLSETATPVRTFYKTTRNAQRAYREYGESPVAIMGELFFFDIDRDPSTEKTRLMMVLRSPSKKGNARDLVSCQAAPGESPWLKTSTSSVVTITGVPAVDEVNGRPAYLGYLRNCRILRSEGPPTRVFTIDELARAIDQDMHTVQQTLEEKDIVLRGRVVQPPKNDNLPGEAIYLGNDSGFVAQIPVRKEWLGRFQFEGVSPGEEIVVIGTFWTRLDPKHPYDVRLSPCRNLTSFLQSD